MRILVTGASGFVGTHLIRRLEQQGCKIFCPSRDVFDITSYGDVHAFFASTQIDAVIHLAAQSNVRKSWDNPLTTVENNIAGTVNVYCSFAQYNPQGIFLNIGSSDVYGLTAQDNQELSEDMICWPQSPYAITKYSVELMLSKLMNKYKTKVISTRSFNHYGPEQQSGFVISDFSSQIAQIKKGQRKAEIYVGNLESKREFIYVSDIIEAYILLLEKNVPSGIYNVSAGKAYSVRWILEQLLIIAGIKASVQVDSKRYRPIDVKTFCGSNEKIRKVTGWQPKVDIRQGLKKTYQYWLGKEVGK